MEDVKIDVAKFRKLRHLLINFMELNSIKTSEAVPMMIDLIFTIFEENLVTPEMVDGYFNEVKSVYRKIREKKEPPELGGGS